MERRVKRKVREKEKRRMRRRRIFVGGIFCWGGDYLGGGFTRKWCL